MVLFFAVIFWIFISLLFFQKVRIIIQKFFIPNGCRSPQYLPCLDAYRGLASLLVAIFHTWQWSRPAFDGFAEVAPLITAGDKAVPMFVTLSGLLIYRSLINLNSIEKVKIYIYRRFSRIYPVYFATVCASFVLMNSTFVNKIPLMQFFISEIFMIRTLGSFSFSNPTSWSLYLEVLFYLVAPIFVINIQKRPIYYTILALVIFALVDSWGTRELALWKYFCIGIITAEIIQRRNFGPIISTLVAFIGFIIICLDVKSGFDWIAYVFTYLTSGFVEFTHASQSSYTLTLGLGVLFLFVGSVRSPLFCHVLEAKPFLFLGAISYSIFMWHSFLIALNFKIAFDGNGTPVQTVNILEETSLSFVMIVIPSIISLASLSFVLFERPFRKDFLKLL